MTADARDAFFRALFTPVHHERWLNRQFTSSHHMPPPEWQITFEKTGGSLEEFEYDRRNTLFGEMTARALRVWLDLKRRGSDALTREEEFAVGEVPGVCAYCTAQQVLNSYPGSNDDPLLRFVAFRGRYIGPCTPEASKGAVVASVEEVLCSPKEVPSRGV
jgi:hypothetical protein